MVFAFGGDEPTEPGQNEGVTIGVTEIVSGIVGELGDGIGV